MKYLYEITHFRSLLLLLLFIVTTTGSIVTRDWADGPGIKLELRRDFLHWSCSPLVPAVQWVPGPFPGVRQPGRGVDYTPPSNTEVKELLQLSLYSPLRAFMASYMIFTFTFYLHYGNLGQS